MNSCQGIVSIPGDLWSSYLKSLQKLWIQSCPDLASIGGPEAIANINIVYIFFLERAGELRINILRRKKRG